MRGVAVSVTGWVVLVVGVAMFPLPGPGLLLIAAGLAILSRRHEWAERRVERVRLRALHGAAVGVQTRLRAGTTIVATTIVGASGLLWLWAPPQPAWWALPTWTWLPGGLWSGIGQLVSGAVALGLVLHSYRRFHGRPDRLRALEDRLRVLGGV